MPQKPLPIKKKIDKKQAANRNGKRSLQRKGHFEKPPNPGSLRSLQYKETKDLSKSIRMANEANIAGIAEQAGGKLKSIKGRPPVLAPKDKTQRAKAAKKAAASKDH